MRLPKMHPEHTMASATIILIDPSCQRLMLRI